TPEQCPSVVSLLSESYNPHVRYGAAMALGICCAAGKQERVGGRNSFGEAINLLEPMTNDPVNYVRQGALIASALIMIQQTEILCPKVSDGSPASEVRQMTAPAATAVFRERLPLADYWPLSFKSFWVFGTMLCVDLIAEC
ncbi:UNVERIFIED_CONTAM: 26S proteasome non-ATPase regulatory subunit 1, partial [Gekko kuhli]